MATCSSWRQLTGPLDKVASRQKRVLCSAHRCTHTIVTRPVSVTVAHTAHIHLVHAFICITEPLIRLCPLMDRSIVFAHRHTECATQGVSLVNPSATVHRTPQTSCTRDGELIGRNGGHCNDHHQCSLFNDHYGFRLPVALDQ